MHTMYNMRRVRYQIREVLARSHETVTALARLREDLPNRKLETGHNVSSIHNVGFGESDDIGL